MLGHKASLGWEYGSGEEDSTASLGKLKKTKIISSIFSNHNAMRLEINDKKKTVKNTNTWRLNNMLLNNCESLKKSNRKSKTT